MGSPEEDLNAALGTDEASADTEVQLVLSDSRVLTVRAVRLGQLGRFSQALKPIWPILAEAMATSEAGGEGDGQAPGRAESMMTMALEHADALCAAIAAATELTQEEAEALPIDDAIRVCEAVVSVNVDFFTHRVLPQVQKMLEQHRDRILEAKQQTSGST